MPTLPFMTVNAPCTSVVPMPTLPDVNTVLNVERGVISRLPVPELYASFAAKELSPVGDRNNVGNELPPPNIDSPAFPPGDPTLICRGVTGTQVPMPTLPFITVNAAVVVLVVPMP